jgi:6-phosphogluconate dehydrogenase (decarboxylating)
MGFLMARELDYLVHKLEHAERPFLVIMGGAKVSDKIKVINALMKKADSFIIGGAMAYTFRKAQGFMVGKSRVETDKLELALDIMKNADADIQPVTHDAETAPRMGNDLDYKLPLGEIAELWRRGSVVQSWLLDLIAISMAEDPDLKKFSGRVSDSGEGRWTIMAAIEEGVPADVLSAALYARFRSQEPAFSDKVCSAMRYQFGGHHEKPAGG